MSESLSSSPTPVSVGNAHAILQLIGDNVVDYAILVLDLQRRITFCNRGVFSLLGYAEAELIGQSADGIFVPEDQASGAPEHEAQTALTQGRAEDERWHQRKDGSRFWGSGVLTCLRGEAQQPLGFVKILRDHTQQHEAQAAKEQLLALQIEQAQQAAILAERQRMAQELHDSLAYGMIAIKLQLDVAEDIFPQEQALPHLQRARELAVQCLTDTRQIVRALRLSRLEGQTLPDLLQRLAEEADGTVQVDFHLQGDAYSLSVETETDLFHIAQEALVNALRHAQAQHIHLSLDFAPSLVELRIEDDGQGFDLSAQPAGYGLRGMQERSQRIGAERRLDSSPGKGTTVRVRLLRQSTL